MNTMRTVTTIHGDDDIIVEKNQNGMETYIFDPYNPLNKEIPDFEIQNILKNYGIDVPIHNCALTTRRLSSFIYKIQRTP